MKRVRLQRSSLGSNSETVVSRRRIEALDGFRAVAAIGVLVYHVGTAQSGFLQAAEPGAHLLANLGNFGVAVFFLLSSFLLFQPFALSSITNQKLPPVAPFYIRRAMRIFPAYWLALVAWSMSVTPEVRASGTAVGKLLLIDQYDPNSGIFTGLAVSWSLAIELAFYIVLPIYAVTLSKLLGRVSSPNRRIAWHAICLAFWYVSAVGYRYWLSTANNGPFRYQLWIFAYLDWFALGMLLALASAWLATGGSLPQSVRDLANRTWACWTIAGMSYASIVILLDSPKMIRIPLESFLLTSLRYALQGFAAFFFLLPAILGGGVGTGLQILGSRPMIWLGKVSFGIYLWHLIVIGWLPNFDSISSTRLRFLTTLAIVLTITVTISATSYYLAERPFIELSRRRGSVPRFNRKMSASRGTHQIEQGVFVK
ncbi:MAG: acyltransferase family protein [Actinobacteria bacterium]|nr:acyltransferase family protein [Actinomycetota bacterium]